MLNSAKIMLNLKTKKQNNETFTILTDSSTKVWMFVFSLTSDQRPYFLLINNFWPKMVFITDFRPEIFTTDFGSTPVRPSSIQIVYRRQ